VRLIVGIVLLLAGVGTLSCRLDGLAVDLPNRTYEMQWVRTVNGWERTDAWFSAEVSPLRLHPLVVATGQVLLSVLALAAYATEQERKAVRPDANDS
jgi:hypothetical protein